MKRNVQKFDRAYLRTIHEFLGTDWDREARRDGADRAAGATRGLSLLTGSEITVEWGDHR